MLNLVASKKTNLSKTEAHPIFALFWGVLYWRKIELLTCIIMKNSKEIKFKSLRALKP